MRIERPLITTGYGLLALVSYAGIADVNDMFGEHALHYHFEYGSLERMLLTVALVSGLCISTVKAFAVATGK